jgi:hypothetical protein
MSSATQIFYPYTHACISFLPTGYRENGGNNIQVMQKGNAIIAKRRLDHNTEALLDGDAC